MTKITAIVPRLPPAIDGLGDYGLSLARQLRQDFGLETEFLVGDANWSIVDTIEDFAVKTVVVRSRQGLWELLPQETESGAIVLLHYVGYGYARRGCPLWLVSGLERWRQAGSNRYLVTMFHEIYAFGAIWTSQFWTSPLQRNLAARLAKLSDVCLTSKQGYAEIISKLSQGKHSHIPALPVFSNVGEPESLPPLIKRSRSLVVFGGPGPRSRVYKRGKLALQRICYQLNITEILDIGSDLGFEIEPVNGIPITSLGVKSAAEISKILSTAMVGFFDYPTEFLAKSGIFAAYCAHKLLPVGVWYEAAAQTYSRVEQEIDDLVAGKHYWLGDRHVGNMNLDAAQIVADNAYTWYQTHQLSVHARTFAERFHLL
ncbi:MAG: glycosyltransferase family 1 protein [Nostocaceae cyanobacterium]|nr:glycosyltransferase family 1 protein [Nostocaceae cyanobacterium]